jgi:hypothetical protein
MYKPHVKLVLFHTIEFFLLPYKPRGSCLFHAIEIFCTNNLVEIYVDRVCRLSDPHRRGGISGRLRTDRLHKEQVVAAVMVVC